MNRFDINTWNIEHITPKNIPYAQWYRLHDDHTFVMLNV